MKPNITPDQLPCPNVSSDHFDALRSGHEELTETFLHTGARKAGRIRVQGVGITAQTVKGRATDEAALLMLVDQLGSLCAMPQRSSGGIPIVYQQVGEIRPTSVYNDRARPAPGGVSIAPVRANYSGTMGCVVSGGDTYYILGTSHLLSDLNSLPPGTAIIQPAAQDGGRPQDAIAELSYFIPIQRSGHIPADAALAKITNPSLVDPRLMRDGGSREAINLPNMEPRVRMDVQKSGRTTGRTSGQISSVALTVMVQYWPGSNTMVENAFTIESRGGPFALAGDSGALVTTSQDNQPVGLLFASGGNAAYACQISTTLRHLEMLVGRSLSIESRMP